MGILLKIYIFFFGKLIAQDIYKNSYYVLKNKKDYLGRAKRFIIYKQSNKINSISSIWHLWLHYQISDIQATNLQISSSNSEYVKIKSDFKIQSLPYKYTNQNLNALQSTISNINKMHKKSQLYQAWNPEKAKKR